MLRRPAAACPLVCPQAAGSEEYVAPQAEIDVLEVVVDVAVDVAVEVELVDGVAADVVGVEPVGVDVDVNAVGPWASEAGPSM